MSKRKKVVTKGGSLYRVTVSGRTHSVAKVKVGFLGDSYKEIGKADSLEDALSIIKSHSGREIDRISNW